MNKVKNKKGNLHERWITLPLPTTKVNRLLQQYNQTNLWIFKNYEGRFGFLITGSVHKPDSSYKNITISWQRKLIDLQSGRTLQQCLIIESAHERDSELFCSVIDHFFGQHITGTVYSGADIEAALEQLERIILKDRDDYNSVVGVWGELYLIDKFLDATINENDKTELISSWEGLKHRSKIDINIKSKGIKIEVKTTTDNIRMHHFNSLDQVSTAGCNLGVVASLCITDTGNGKTCLDLVLSIKAKLPRSSMPLIDERIKLRGKECLNNKFRFDLASMRELEFFEFSETPKPSIVPGVSRIEWGAILDNKAPLNANEKQKLFCVLN